jgi:hypothetical protein
MGVLVIIAAIIRLIRTVKELNSSTNVPFASYDIVIWTSIEVCTGLVCAAAPATRPFISMIAPSFLASEPRETLNNTVARRRNYAEGTFDMGSPGRVIIGKSGTFHKNGTQ